MKIYFEKYKSNKEAHKTIEESREPRLWGLDCTKLLSTELLIKPPCLPIFSYASLLSPTPSIFFFFYLLLYLAIVTGWFYYFRYLQGIIWGRESNYRSRLAYFLISFLYCYHRYLDFSGSVYMYQKCTCMYMRIYIYIVIYVIISPMFTSHID